MTKEWISLNPYQLQIDTQRKNPLGEHVPSPYDIPESLRLIKDEDSTTIEVDFAYIGEDEEKILSYDRSGVRIEVGKHSRRIRSIQVSKSRHREPELLETEEILLSAVDQFMAAVDSLIDSVENEENTEKRTLDNYKIAREALISNKERIDLHAA